MVLHHELTFIELPPETVGKKKGEPLSEAEKEQ
jgi:hypothetical protein